MLIVMLLIVIIVMAVILLVSIITSIAKQTGDVTVRLPWFVITQR
jgi:hypothetical protein